MGISILRDDHRVFSQGARGWHAGISTVVQAGGAPEIAWDLYTGVFRLGDQVRAAYDARQQCRSVVGVCFLR